MDGIVIDWKPIEQIEFSNNAFTQFHVDTRDFCVDTSDTPIPKIDLHKTKKHPNNFFHTADEIRDLLVRYKKESGGDVEWRFFSLSAPGRFRTSNWQLKYIRIYKLKQGLVIYNPDEKYLFSKDILASPIAQEHLNAH